MMMRRLWDGAWKCARREFLRDAETEVEYFMVVGCVWGMSKNVNLGKLKMQEQWLAEIYEISEERK